MRCRRIAYSNAHIPYGFAFSEKCFGNDGSYKQMEVGKGLTCATFIIALFHSFALPIVRLESWIARPEDAEWQKTILRILEQRASKEHIAAATAYIGQFRYRAEEVAAAATSPTPPLDYNECTGLAAAILATIRAAGGTAAAH